MANVGTSEYHVYDASVGPKLGEVSVQDRKSGDKTFRTIQLTAEQAKYWISQGVIGVRPLAELKPESRNAAHALTGGGVPKDEVAKKPAAAPLSTGSVTVDKGMSFKDKK